MKRLLISLSAPMSYAVMRPLHEALAPDPRIDITFTVRVPARRTLSRVGLKDVKCVTPFFASRRTYDVALCPGYFFQGRKVGTHVQVFHGTSLKYYAIHEKARLYDRLFVIGPHMRKKFVETRLFEAEDPRLCSIGMPKLDALVDGSLERAEILARIGAPVDRRTVLYAPTWSSSTPSSLETVGLELIELMSRVKNTTLLVKLHDKSLKAFRRRQGTRWEKVLARYSDRVWWVQDYDVTPWLFVADALISDLSSVAYEYTLLDRPILFLENPEKVERLLRDRPESVLASWGRDCGEVLTDVGDVPSAVEECLNDPTPRSAVRHQFAREFFYHPGGATQAAVAAIYEALDLSPP